MSKPRKSTKEAKKQPLLNFKEKRAKKKFKTEESTNTPISFPKN